jgi:hypothetical protein
MDDPDISSLCRFCVEGSSNLAALPNITEGIATGLWIPCVIDEDSVQRTSRGDIVVEFVAPALLHSFQGLELEYHALVAGVQDPQPDRPPPASSVYDVLQFHYRFPEHLARTRPNSGWFILPKPLCLVPNLHAGMNGLF